METGVVVTIAIFMIGVIYAAGRLSVRVEHLEVWREEARKEAHEIFQTLRRLERLMRGEGEP